MSHMMLVNPRKRRHARRRNPTGGPVAAPARRPARVARRVARRTARRVTRGTNPIRARVMRRVARRRRNPINMSASAKGAVALLKEALIGGAGAIAVDLAMGQVNDYLPASLQRVAGTVGVGDAVKMLLTIVAGNVLNKPTKGLAAKAALGALTVQAHGILATFLPGTMTLGYAVPGQVMQGQARIANMRNGLSRYTTNGQSPLLSRYTQPGVSPLLNGSRGMAMARDGVHIR